MVDKARAMVEKQKKEWKKYGCIILSNEWIDGTNRTIINRTNKVENAHTLALMLENVIMEVGVENMVQIIIDNATAYVAKGNFNFSCCI